MVIHKSLILAIAFVAAVGFAKAGKPDIEPHILNSAHNTYINAMDSFTDLIEGKPGRVNRLIGQYESKFQNKADNVVPRSSERQQKILAKLNEARNNLNSPVGELRSEPSVVAPMQANPMQPANKWSAPRSESQFGNNFERPMPRSQPVSPTRSHRQEANTPFRPGTADNNSRAPLRGAFRSRPNTQFVPKYVPLPPKHMYNSWYRGPKKSPASTNSGSETGSESGDIRL